MAQEDDLAITKRALGLEWMEGDAECERAEAVRQDYRARIRASTTSCQHSLDFDRVLRGRQFILTVWEMDLKQWENRLVEEQVWGLYPFDGRDLSVEVEEVREHMAGVENERTVEAMQLSRSVKEISDALVDWPCFPFGTSLRIQNQLRMSWRWSVSFRSACGRNMPPALVPRSEA
jgi:hypothetical protein